MDVGDLFGAAGVTKPEVLAFLTERGVKTSGGAVNAWARGLYQPPTAALGELLLLARAVAAGDEEALPLEAPEGARRRCRTMAALR